ncbi:hypothetical protein V5799_009670, partial [Amblyomma americanum]
RQEGAPHRRGTLPSDNGAVGGTAPVAQKATYASLADSDSSSPAGINRRHKTSGTAERACHNQSSWWLEAFSLRMSWSLEGRSIETWQPCCEDEEESLPSQERATSQEIELKEDIKEALKANGIYSNDKLYDTMAVLEILGVKAAQHFELLETEDLVSRGMPPETADTLLKEFGTSLLERSTQG